MIKNILLDRDGTVIEDKNYLSNPNKVIFIEGAIDALKKACQKGLNLFFVTNQSGIGRGIFSVEDYKKVRQRIHEILSSEGINIKDEVFCPHKPEDGCDCRKPSIGMWQTLRRKYKLNPEESIIIGDKMSDMEFGIRAHLALKILVLTGYGKKEIERVKSSYTDLKKSQMPDFIARDLFTAIKWMEENLFI